MYFCGRAYYNLLIMNPDACQGVDVLPWQCEDYRVATQEELFSRLADFGLSEEAFLSLTEELAAPEQAMEHIEMENDEQFEQVYLLIFELWRRLYPERQSLSIFCDELDHIIMQYQLEEVSSEKIVETLDELERVLDENFDHGVDTKEIFETVRCHMAHDLESFLFDFISLQIESHNEEYASELIEDFYPYVERDHWFDFLRVRLTVLLDTDEASFMLSHLLDKLEEKKDKRLLFEVLEFLASYGENASYLSVFTMLLGLIDSKEEFVDLAEITSNYFKQYAIDVNGLQSATEKVSDKSSSVTAADLDQLREITFTGLKSI